MPILLENGSGLLLEDGAALLLEGEGTSRDLDYLVGEPFVDWVSECPVISWRSGAPEA